MKGNLWNKNGIKRAAFDTALLRARVKNIKASIKDKKDKYDLNKAVESINGVMNDFVDASAGPLRKVAERFDVAIKACGIDNTEVLSRVVDDATDALHAAIDEGCKPLHEAADSIELSLTSVAEAIHTIYNASTGDQGSADKMIDDAATAFLNAGRASIITADAPLRALTSAADAALNAIRTRNMDVPLIVLAADLVHCIRNAQDEVDESFIRMANLLEATIHSATTTVHVNDSPEIVETGDQPISLEEMDTVTTPWKRLLIKSLHSNSLLGHPSTYFQLATVSNGLPANRTVYFRGFQDATDKIQIHTDSRSHKIEDIKQLPSAEICWYFSDSWEQFRIKGAVDVIDGSNSDPIKLQQREKAWFASSPKSNPGIPSLVDQLTQVPSSLDPSVGPVEAFCLLVLDPDQVDYLNLKSNERINFSRKIANEEISWISEKVNP